MPPDLALALALLPDFSLILLGAGLRRVLNLGDHFWNGLEKLVYYLLFPALLFAGLLKARIDWGSAAPMLMVAAATLASGMALGLLTRLLPITPISFASQFQCAFRFNSYIGLAVAGTLYGLPGIVAMGIVIGFMVPPANLAAVWMLARHGETGVLRELARNPLILATLAGLAANFAGLQLPAVLAKFLGRLGDTAIVLGLLAVGAGLRIVGTGGPAAHTAAAWILAVKLLAMPAFALLMIGRLGLGGVHAGVALIFAALPAATSSYILVRRMGGDGPPVAWLISAGTLLSMFSIPLWLSLR